MAGARKEYEMLFRIQAETAQYQKQMGAAAQEMGALKSSLAALNGGMKDIAGYQKQQDALGKSQQKAAVLKAEHDKLQAELKQTGTGNTQLQAKVQRTEERMASANKKVQEQKEKLEQDGEALRRAGINTQDLTGENARLKAGYDDLARSQNDIAALEQAQKDNKEAIQATTAELGRTVAAYAAVGVAAYKAFVSPAMEFEAQMSVAQSISGAGQADMEKLSALAKEMGATTKFTAVESAKGYEYMAMAGWDAQEMLAGLPGIIDLAAASGEDLASVSDIVTDALTAFGLKASDSAHFSDVLARASSRSNTNVALMGETFKYVAPMAGAMGYSVEDMAVAIGLMANSGIKGSMAGTSLRNIISNMAAPTDAVAKAMERLDVSVSNTDGTAKSFEEVMHDIRDGMMGMTEAEQVATASAIAGKRGMSGLLAVVNSTEEDYASLYSEIENCNGAAREMSQVRLDNLKGDVTIMQSAWEGFATVIGEEFTPDLREAVQGITGYIDEARVWAKENGDVIREVVGVVGALAGLKLGFLATKLVGLQFGKVLLGVQSAATKVSAGMKLLAQGKTLTEVAAGMGGAAAGMTAFVTAGAAVAVGAVAVGAAVYKLWQEAKQADLEQRFGGIALSMEDLDQVAAHLVQNRHMEGVAQAMEAFGAVGDVAADLETVRRELDKYDWKIGIGIQLDAEDQEDYREAMAAYVDSIQDYVEDQGYALQLGVKTMFLDDPNAGGKISDNVAAVTAALQGRVAEMGAELSQHMAAAFEDGMFDIDEYRAASKLQEKLAEIERISTQSEYKAKMTALGAQYGAALTPESYQQLMTKAGELAQQNAEDVRGSYEKTLAAAYTNAEYAQWLYDEDGSAENLRLMTEANKAVKDAEGQMKNVDAIAAQSYAGVVDMGIQTLYAAYPEMEKLVSEAERNMDAAYRDAVKNGKTSQKEMQAAAASSTKDQRDKYDALGATTKANISDSMDVIRDYVEEMKKAGTQVPEEINKLIEAYDLMGIVRMPDPVRVVKQGVTVESYGNEYYMRDYVWRQGAAPETGGSLAEMGGVNQAALDSFLRSGGKGFARGTNSTPAAFVAGERGPELIVNAPGRTVYTAGETRDILDPERGLAPLGNRTEVRVELHSSPTINASGGAEEIKTALREHDEELLVRAVGMAMERLDERAEDERRLRYD